MTSERRVSVECSQVMNNKLLALDETNMLKRNLWLLIFGCPLDNQNFEHMVTMIKSDTSSVQIHSREGTKMCSVQLEVDKYQGKKHSKFGKLIPTFKEFF